MFGAYVVLTLLRHAPREMTHTEPQAVAPPSHTLPILVAIYWCLRQLLGADPRVPCALGLTKLVRVLTYAECALAGTTVTPEAMAALRARYLALPRAERTVSIPVLEAVVDLYTEAAKRVAETEARTGIRPKSEWTVGRKGPAQLRDYTGALLAHVRSKASVGDTVDVPGLISVHGLGVWCVTSILHYVLDLPVYVPGDSRVGANARRCTPLAEAVRAFTGRAANKKLRNEDVDAYLLATFRRDVAPCTKARWKRKRGGGAPVLVRCQTCVACLTMGEALRRMYECLNTPKVSPATVEATWRACGGRTQG